MLIPLAVASSLLAGQQAPERDDPPFHPPVRITADGAPVQVESPGFAAPCLADVDGDGHRDLIVGQFADGKMRVYPGLEGGGYGPGDWLLAEGDVAEVPGVW